MALITYPAISLWQPFAQLLFTVKTHETPDYAPPPKYVGKRILIHAAKSFKGLDDMEDDLRLVCIQQLGPAFEVRLPRGVLLGTAVLRRAFPIIDTGSQADSDEDRICGFWAPGRWAWEFTDREMFDQPIPARGHQGWWPQEIEEPA